MAPHVLVGTLAMVFFFQNAFRPNYGLHYCQMCMTPTIVNIFIRMHMALHVPFKTFVIAYIFVRMCLVLTMAYIIVKMCLAPLVPFVVLVMVYVPFETCLI